MRKIAIVVPVYNVERYIRRCVQSVLSQTYENFILVLVDDGSSDHSGKICDEYAKLDSRINVIHQKNAGLSAARNAGIDWMVKNTECEWISFIDSDDWVHPRYLELLLESAEKHNAQISSCLFRNITDESLPDFDIWKSRLYSAEEYFKIDVVNAIVAWGKLYKIETFDNIRFPEGKFHEDEFTTYKIIFSYEKVAAVDQFLYAYFKNTEGIMHSGWSVKRLDRLEALEQQVDFFLNRSYIEIANDRFWALLYFCWSYQDEIEKSKDFSNDEKKKYILDLRKRMRYFLHKYREYRWVSLFRTGEHLHVLAYAYPTLKIPYYLYLKLKDWSN